MGKDQAVFVQSSTIQLFQTYIIFSHYLLAVTEVWQSKLTSMLKNFFLNQQPCCLTSIHPYIILTTIRVALKLEPFLCDFGLEAGYTLGRLPFYHWENTAIFTLPVTHIEQLRVASWSNLHVFGLLKKPEHRPQIWGSFDHLMTTFLQITLSLSKWHTSKRVHCTALHFKTKT